VALTPLVGRLVEVEAIVRLLGEPHLRLLTLLGPGGIGKTRLALQAAETVAASFPDGVAFVGLAPIQEAGPVLSTIGDALGVRETADRSLRDGLIAALGQRRLLLILDNCEHVVAAAPRIAELLAACPRLVVLATSRQPLRISGEREWPVPPLSLGRGDEETRGRGELTTPSSHRPIVPSSHRPIVSDAVSLFVERAKAVLPGFELTDENAGTIEEICRRLDGLPLAIELAAARLKVLSPSALLFRLERRLPLLTRGTRDVPTRLLTMRDAIAWSYDLLSPEEQRLFARLSAFAGGFGLEAAAHVAADGDELAVLDGIASLTDKSLLLPEPGVADDPAAERYGMLETIREYGLEQLAAGGEAAEVRAHHAGWFLELARQATRARSGPRWGGWLRRLEGEHANLRAALAFAIEADDATLAYDLIANLYRFWEARGHLAEGCDWFERTEAALGRLRTIVRAMAATGAATLWIWRGQYIQAEALATESLSLARELDDRAEVAAALALLGIVAFDRGDWDGSWRYHEEALTLRRAMGDDQAAAMALVNLAVLRQRAGDSSAARDLCEEALALRRPANDLQTVSFALGVLGTSLHHLGDLHGARAALEEAIELRKRMHSGHFANLLVYLAALERDEGHVERATDLYQESVILRRARGEIRGVLEALAGLGILAVTGGQAELGVRLLAAVDELTKTLHRVIALERDQIEQALAVARRDLGGSAFAAAWAAGKALPLEALIALSAEVTPATAPPFTPGAEAEPSDLPGGLSPRELEVLRLVATGLTDAEVGERLFISPRTVSRHLQTIYRKLDVTSRTAASAFAYDQGLV
jgi:non-specific serine/threonine protein kinase